LKWSEWTWARAAFGCTFASAAAVVVSITASQALLGAALLCLLAARARPRLPPVALPLGLFLAWTLAALVASPEPAAGLPQLMKFFVFLTLVAVSSTFEQVAQARALVLAWAGLGTASAAWSLVQYWRASREYGEYVLARTTGFMSHWMTFGGVSLMVLVMLVALLLFGTASRRLRRAGWAAAAVLSYALLLNGTRNIWVGGAVAMMYLAWSWRRWAVLALPLVAAAGVALSPSFVRQRVVSLVRPHGELDSNLHRQVTLRTGLRMIAAHPWLGVGPERVGRTFVEHLPADVKPPLPDGFYGHLHNVYLQYAAERGLPALFFLLWMLGRIVVDFARAPARGDERFLVRGAFAAVTALMIGGLAEHNLGDSEILAVFLAVVSCGYLAREGAAGGGKLGSGAR